MAAVLAVGVGQIVCWSASLQPPSSPLLRLVFRQFLDHSQVEIALRTTTLSRLRELPGEVTGASVMRRFAQYALMLVLITVVGIATLTVLGQNSNNTFTTVKNALPTGS
jgi:Flp pilus assembly pilin Flp